MADDLNALDDWLTPLIQSLQPAARRRLLRTMAGELRTGQRQRIAAQRNPDGSTFEPRRPRQRKALRARGKMFLKIRRARHMRIDARADQARIGYGGRIARIARIHQEGLLDKVSPRGPLYRYPARQLLGVTADDRDHALDAVLDYLSERSST